MRKRQIRQAGKEKEELEQELIEELDALSNMLRELDLGVSDDDDDDTTSASPATSPPQTVAPEPPQSLSSIYAEDTDDETRQRFEALVEQMVDMAVERELNRIRGELRSTIFKQVMGRMRRARG